MDPLMIFEAYMMVARSNYHLIQIEKLLTEDDMLAVEEMLMKMDLSSNPVAKIALRLVQKHLNHWN